jgi:hydrophobe/amphiphile efflux-3 (HAE3) family protein
VNPSRLLARIMGAAVRRPLVVGAVVGVVAVAGGLLALRLTPTAATDTLVGRSTPSFAATDELHRKFGEEAVYVLVREPVAKLVLTSDLERMVGLEGCIGGNVPNGVVPRGGPNGPCAQLGRTKPAKVVFGPGTFINESVIQIQDALNAAKDRYSQQAAAAAAAARELAKGRGYSKARQDKLASEASQLVFAQFTEQALQIAFKYGIAQVPQLNDTQFVSKLVFDSTAGPGVPKQRFAYIFPNKSSSLIQVRLKPGLSESRQRRAIALIRKAVAMPDWRLPNGHGTYVVTGAPVVVGDLTKSISHSLLALLIAALVVMALTLAIVFRARLRLLPLLVALAAVGVLFGGLSLSGGSLTMASIGVLPVLLGLGVDYAIQLQSRLQEDGRPLAEAVPRVAARGAPTVAIAAAATAAGFLALELSPVPMVRGFGILLVLGIVLAFGAALTLGVAALALPRPRARPRLAAAGESVAAAWRGAGELLVGNRPARWLGARGAAAGRGAMAAALGNPRRVVGIALAVAALGWALDTQTRVESDVQKLVPQNMQALRDLRTLERSTGVGGEIDVLVDSNRLTDPTVVSWLGGYQSRILRYYGYSAKRGCGKAEVCPAFSLPDLFRTLGSGATRQDIENLLAAVPAYFSQGVITPDHRTATLAFGIRLMPLDRQKRVIDRMRAGLRGAPPGVRAQLAGLPVLAAEANARISSSPRRLLTLLAGLLAVALVLFVALRSWQRALVPLVPIALATGWSALILFLTRIPLNPMSVTLGALVIAISTEFSVLLAERFRAERAAGWSPPEALARTYRSTGAAVLASGTTAIAGFAVLIVSSIAMLRDFGFVTVIDLTVALAGVMVVLPAVLVLDERGELLRAPALRRPRLPLPRLPRRRREEPASGRAPAA